MKLPTDHAVHVIAKELWVDSGNDHDDWVYQPPESLKRFFTLAQTIHDAAGQLMKAAAWDEGYGLGYSDAIWSKGHEPGARNPYRPAA